MDIKKLPYGGQMYLARRFNYSKTHICNILKSGNRAKYSAIFAEAESMIARGSVVYRNRYAVKHADIISALSPCKYKILLYIVLGKNTKEIAALMRTSTSTVNTHRTQLKEIFEVESIELLVAKYMECIATDNLLNIVRTELIKANREK